ncbi:L-seryl-tRNA(Sec) selenium transferase [soil metagenome]
MNDNPFQQLPSVSKLLDRPFCGELQRQYTRDAVVLAIRSEVELWREALAQKEPVDFDEAHLVERLRTRLESDSEPHYREVINATGIVLHTNLGRSVLAPRAARAAMAAASAYSNLEMDLNTGERSKRQKPISDEIQRLTGAEAGTAVNNCAAATVITLKALAAGREVIVSRGQLIEIGGSFRIPEIMAASGAILKEVGTTNITRLSDYENAITSQTALLMRVHTSNYRIRGFTEAVSLESLVTLGRNQNVPVVDDVGSGLIADLGFESEPNVLASLKTGADLVLFSGDKLLGGPQAGLIVGKAKLIAMIEKDPLMRAFRLDKMTLAALEATLRLYRDSTTVRESIPTLSMLTMPLDVLRQRTLAFAEGLRAVPGITVEVLDDVAFVGGGSLPDESFPTVVIAIRTEASAEAFAATLRSRGVVARIKDDVVRIDLRTVLDHQSESLFNAIAKQ